MIWERIVFPVLNMLLLRHRVVLWQEYLNEESAKRICTSIARLNAESGEPIFLHFFSSGGGGESMRSVIEAVRGSVAPITGVTDIHCMSAAFFVLQACKTRLARPNTTFMFHGGSLGKLRIDQPDLEERLAEYRREHGAMMAHIVARSGKVTLEEVLKLAETEKEFDTAEALRMGFIDSIEEK